jgi:prephenate dehydrogenase
MRKKIVRKPHFKKVVIAGIGLMGGSLGLAIKKGHLADTVVGFARRQQTLQQARAKRCIDQGTLSIEQAVTNADLIILAAPVRTIPILLQAMLPHLSSGCLITDVGSTKAELLETINRQLVAFHKKNPKTKVTFVGSHPMAGSEKAGVLASRVDLYQRSLCMLIKTAKTPKAALIRLRKFWSAVGCGAVNVVSAKQHDQWTALVSHLPHLVAVALVNQLCSRSRQDKEILKVVATGFRDTTRVAAGAPHMWLDILKTNRKEIVRAIDQFQRQLNKLKRIMQNKQEAILLQELEQASEFRLRMESTKRGRKNNKSN